MVQGLYVQSCQMCKSNVNSAISDGVYDSDRNPFKGRIAKPISSSSKVHLTKEEINNLLKLHLIFESSLWHTRNAFVFALCNGGMRISDIFLLKWSNIISNNKIEYSMKKTGETSTLPLHLLSLSILEKYHERKYAKKYVFPFLDSLKDGNDYAKLEKTLDAKKAYFNKNLKKIAEKANLDKHLTSHVARHTYAGFTIQAGNNPAITRSILKHKSQATTDRYIGTLDTTLIDDAHLNSLNGLSTTEFFKNTRHPFFAEEGSGKELFPNEDMINNLTGYSAIEKMLRRNAKYFVHSDTHKEALVELKKHHIPEKFIDDILGMTSIFLHTSSYQSNPDYRKSESAKAGLSKLIAELVSMQTNDEIKFHEIKITVKGPNRKISSFIIKDHDLINKYFFSASKKLATIRNSKRKNFLRNTSIQNLKKYLDVNGILTKENCYATDRQLSFVYDWFCWCGIISNEDFQDSLSSIRSILTSKP